MAIKVFGIICLFIWFLSEPNIKNRQLEYNGSTVMTTFEIEDKFYGKYKGRKSGFLLLNNDGSGIYRYDYPEMSPECYGENIEFIWGFIVDDNGEIVKFKRTYGYSYPIIYNCSGENAFQGCSKRTMVDYVLEYDDGTITISSSDDWIKIDN
ncbi:MAG: hypothetical protein KAR17_12125 [Cyclobacteriaceae bacterium]|nr:hypothetical protein [Cyclobacteriaceae bacterium]